MKARIILACGALASSGCTPTDRARDPAHLPRGTSTTVSTRTIDVPAPAVTLGDGAAGPLSEPVASTRAEQAATERSPTAVPRAEESRISGADPDSVVTQGHSDVDLMITQQIRRGLDGNPELSSAAKHVLVSTQGGEVTLRGAVKTDQERQIIADTARKIAGARKVDVQLDVHAREGT